MCKRDIFKKFIDDGHLRFRRAFANDDLTVSLVLGLKKKKKKVRREIVAFFCFGRAQPRVAIGVCTCYVFRHIYPLYFYLCALCVCVCVLCTVACVYMVGGG